MIGYLYSLDYQVKNCHPESEHVISDEVSITKDPESTTALGSHSSQQSDREADPGSESKSNELDEDSLVSFDPLSFHILMYSLADRMFIEGLKAISKDKVERELAQILDPNTFPHTIFEIYNSTPATDRGLRDLAVEMTMNHLTELRTSDESDRVAFLENLVTKVPQSSSDLLVAIMNRSVADWRHMDNAGGTGRKRTIFGPENNKMREQTSLRRSAAGKERAYQRVICFRILQ